ncbi:MAG: hypothetical protein IJ683_07070 [Butyrivibrio sp.]|nr:hypothetical protein [Butyrivibrio sp.]MBR1642064.1 hypothetical protein [Butyrivibrio sp.]
MIAVIVAFVLGVVVTILFWQPEKKKLHNKIGQQHNLAEKHLDMFFLMNQWVKDYQDGKKIEKYLLDKGIRRIAIYGMSYIGETFAEELRKSQIEVAYGIDNRKDDIYADFPMCCIRDDLPKVDAIVVTAISGFESIKNDLLKKVDCEIISLELMLYKL